MRFLEKIIHSVVPHPKNRNIPHLLQAEFVGVLSIFVITLFFLNQNNFYLISGLGLSGAIYPAVITDMTNHDRKEAGIPKLAWNDKLENAAKLKVKDMVQNSYFAHTSPAGITPWHWFTEAKYDFIYAGENLAVDFTESADVQKAWLNSPTHRANVLSSNYTEIGITAMNGTLNGHDTIFVVEFFGKPKTLQEANVVKATTKTETPIKIIKETTQATEKFIGVQNLDAKEEVLGTTSIEQEAQSTWYMRLAVNPTNTIKAIYGTILGLILVAMILVMTKEYQRHHTKHLIMGLLLIALTGAFFYLMNSPSIILAIS